MSGLLIKKINEKVSLRPGDAEIIRQSVRVKKLKRKQFLSQEGESCNRIAFVESGALFAYSTDNKGVEHVLQFAFEGWWIGDLYSYFSREPSRLNIQALEDGELLLLEREDQEKLFKKVPLFETYTRILYQDAYEALQRRVEGTLGLSGEEKYLRFLERYASIAGLLPVHIIASYLGITPESLSRIRKNLIP